MLVRLAIEEDENAIVAMARANCAETTPHDLDAFSEDRVRLTFHAYLNTANPTFWIVEKRMRPVGLLVAVIGNHMHKNGHFTTQRVIYVTPENRGSRAAVLLMRQLISWSRHIGADEIVGGNDNSFQSDRTAAFLGHFGFEKVGYAMTLRLSDGRK